MQVHHQLAATDDDVVDCARLALMRHAGAGPEQGQVDGAGLGGRGRLRRAVSRIKRDGCWRAHYFFWRIDMEEKQMNVWNSVMSIIGLVLLAESAAAQEELMGTTTISRKRMDGFPS